jgi:hypothetical protein
MVALPQSRIYLFLITLLCLSGVARAQSGGTSVKMSGGVREMVALSSGGGMNVSADGVRVTSSHTPDRSLSITLSGTTRHLTWVSIPVQIRSNAGYSLLAAAKADGADLSSLSVADAYPTGDLVAADAVSDLSVAVIFDARPGAGKLSPADGFNHPNLSSPVKLLSGPRVSMGGLPGSPQNALGVTLSLVVAPHAGNQAWAIELLLSAAPASRPGREPVGRSLSVCRSGAPWGAASERVGVCLGAGRVSGKARQGGGFCISLAPATKSPPELTPPGWVDTSAGRPPIRVAPASRRTRASGSAAGTPAGVLGEWLYAAA